MKEGKVIYYLEDSQINKRINVSIYGIRSRRKRQSTHIYWYKIDCLTHYTCLMTKSEFLSLVPEVSKRGKIRWTLYLYYGIRFYNMWTEYVCIVSVYTSYCLIVLSFVNTGIELRWCQYRDLTDTMLIKCQYLMKVEQIRSQQKPWDNVVGLEHNMDRISNHRFIPTTLFRFCIW